MAGSRHVVSAKMAHVRPIALSLREQDRAEVWASSRSTPLAAVRKSFLLSDHAWTALDPETGEPFAMFGVVLPSVLADEASVWALGTDGVRRWAVPFAKHSRFYVKRMLTVCDVLTNYVDVRNTVSRAWLRWLGAAFDEPAPYGPDGMLFQRFEITKERTDV